MAVFVPGVLAGSATYEKMNRGVLRAAKDAGASVQTIEGGFNQAEWKSRIQALAAEECYDLIVTSNPSMPEICREIGASFPEQEFLNLESRGIPDDRVTTFEFRHGELAWVLGYMAGLITSSEDLEGCSLPLKAGMIAGQEYPEMMQTIKPAFEEGLKAACPGAELDFRLVGNWYDAAKAADLARSMFAQGVDVILPIAGGAGQGVISVAEEEGKYILWYDSNGYALKEGIILGSGIIHEDKAAYELTLKALKGKLDRGSRFSGGMAEGYVDFIDEDPFYVKYTPKAIRFAMARILKERRGENRS